MACINSKYNIIIISNRIIMVNHLIFQWRTRWNNLPQFIPAMEQQLRSGCLQLRKIVTLRSLNQMTTSPKRQIRKYNYGSLSMWLVRRERACISYHHSQIIRRGMSIELAHNIQSPCIIYAFLTNSAEREVGQVKTKAYVGQGKYWCRQVKSTHRSGLRSNGDRLINVV